uniref:Uncharacterized protein n=1 Tax=Panagrolaimus superbus TaxID=310955 RepID=A0A914YG12_9BILA
MQNVPARPPLQARPYFQRPAQGQQQQQRPHFSQYRVVQASSRGVMHQTVQGRPYFQRVPLRPGVSQHSRPLQYHQQPGYFSYQMSAPSSSNMMPSSSGLTHPPSQHQAPPSQLQVTSSQHQVPPSQHQPPLAHHQIPPSQHQVPQSRPSSRGKQQQHPQIIRYAIVPPHQHPSTMRHPIPPQQQQQHPSIMRLPTVPPQQRPTRKSTTEKRLLSTSNYEVDEKKERYVELSFYQLCLDTAGKVTIAENEYETLPPELIEEKNRLQREFEVESENSAKRPRIQKEKK